jgi:hypothetical protein
MDLYIVVAVLQRMEKEHRKAKGGFHNDNDCV